MAEVTQLIDRLTAIRDFLTDHKDFFAKHSYEAACEEVPNYEDRTYLSFYQLPYNLTISCNGPVAAALMAKTCKELGGKWEKDATEHSFNMQRDLDSDLRISLRVEAPRDLVCTPRVVGTKTVKRPDYNAAPTIEVEVDVVEYDCPPSLLALASE